MRPCCWCHILVPSAFAALQSEFCGGISRGKDVVDTWRGAPHGRQSMEALRESPVEVLGARVGGGKCMVSRAERARFRGGRSRGSGSAQPCQGAPNESGVASVWTVFSSPSRRRAAWWPAIRCRPLDSEFVTSPSRARPRVIQVNSEFWIGLR